MQRLEGFPRIAYDTNCLVYYCFEVNIPDSNPRRTVRAELTGRTKAITEILKNKGQEITTIQAAYRELQDCVYSAVEDEMDKPGVKEMLGIAQSEPVREQTKWHVVKTVEKHVKKLENASWFVLNRDFTPSATAFDNLRQFFDLIPSEELGNSERASAVDIALVNFGAVFRIPLLTNDAGIYKFATKLSSAGLGFRIYGLMELSPS
jgi:hypothetical protein